jgi:hypothetical protein
MSGVFGVISFSILSLIVILDYADAISMVNDHQRKALKDYVDLRK